MQVTIKACCSHCRNESLVASAVADGVDDLEKAFNTALIDFHKAAQAVGWQINELLCKQCYTNYISLMRKQHPELFEDMAGDTPHS